MCLNGLLVKVCSMSALAIEAVAADGCKVSFLRTLDIGKPFQGMQGCLDNIVTE